MTMTIKLDPEMERQLRQRSAALGKPASAIIREALSAWLESTEVIETSAFKLGEDLFGKHEGPEDLADRRKSSYADLIASKHSLRE